MVNEMAKRKANFMDIILFVVLIALVVLGAYKMIVVNKDGGGEDGIIGQMMEYDAVIDKVRMVTVEALHEGDLVFDEKTGLCVGTIQDVSYTPMLENIPDGNGSYYTVEHPDYYTVTLIIEGDILEKEEGYFAQGVTELKINSEMNIYTKYAAPVMKIMNFDI